MKILKLPLALFAVAFTLFAAAPPEQTLPPLNDFIVKVNATNWLAATEIRFIPGKFGIDRTNGLPVLSGTIEAWGDDVDNGVTNKSVLRRQVITLTQNQLDAWNGQTGTNGFTWLRNALLVRTKLTPRP